MCLIVFGYKTVPGYRLILAANRDEFYERPSLSAQFWDEDPDLLAGKDLVAGGTWLGIRKNGRLGMLTNYREMGSHDPNAKSRGFLVRDFLQSRLPAKQFLINIIDPVDYNGFNLLADDTSNFCHFSNITNHTSIIEPGVHGISNALTNTAWPKVEEARHQFQKLMMNNTLSEVNLFQLLTDDETYPENQLPETGLPQEMEKAVSAIFIKTEDYGTRCSTVVYIRNDGRVRFTERVYKPGSDQIKEENSFEFVTEPEG